jgi:hypothetical protein
MRARLPVGLSVLAAICLQAQPASPAPARAPLPELTVSDVTHTPYAFVGEPARSIRFCERTHNRGSGGTRRRLHNIMVLVGPGVSQVVARRDVPRLPGTADARRGRHFSHRGCGRGDAVPLDVPPGAYEVQICADQALRQRNVNNNCYIRDKAFFVIKRDWTGTASGEAPIVTSPTANETWQSATVSYRFQAATNASAGQFAYSFFAGGEGNVSYQVSGNILDCTAAGGATFQPDFGKLEMDYAREHYTLVGEVPVRSEIPITMTCPETTDPAVVFAVNPFVTNGGTDGFTNALPFGTRVLTGTYLVSASGVQKYRSTWTLR